MIVPTNGRIVWFTPPANEANGMTCYGDVPLAAMVVHVWGDRCVNLAVFDANGIWHSFTSVTLLQDEDAKPELGRYAEWMPFQKGQAKATADPSPLPATSSTSQSSSRLLFP